MEDNRWFNVSAGNGRDLAPIDTDRGPSRGDNTAGYWLDDMYDGLTWCDWIGEQSCVMFRQAIGGNGQTFPPFATAINNPTIQNMVSAFVTNAAYVYYPQLTPEQAYNHLVNCCKLNNNNNTGDIPCNDIFANLQVQAGWCQKWQQAIQSGNQLQIQSEITNLANTYNITMPQAESIFMRCCPGTGDNPCPPTDPNSPWNLLGENNFCNSDWCNQYASNSPNHPDCVCCDDGTGNGSDIPCKYVTSHGICQQYWGHMNNGDGQAAMQAISTFANQEGISSPAAYALVLKCCPDDGTGREFPCNRITQDWCNKFQAAFPYGQNSPNMQGTVNPFINFAAGLGYTLSYNDAYALLLKCCGDGQTGEPCPPTNPNSPFYTTDNFCNSDWCVDGQGNPLPNAHPDCICCPPDNDIDVSPWCPEYVIAVDNADLSGMQTIITTVSTTFGITWQEASQLLYDECICPDNNTSGGCPPTNPNSPFYTNPGEFCGNCGPGQFYDGHVDCKCCDGNSSAGPCDGFVDNGCCGKCDTWNGDPTTNNMGGLPLMGPNHTCSQFCAQYGADCCPNLGGNSGGGGGTGGGRGTTMPTGNTMARVAAPGSADNPIGMGSLTELPKNFSGNGFSSI